MKKSVLISIQPKWCRLIADGRKTLEVRKSRPKLETPFKVYIYCTKGNERLLEVMKDGGDCYGEIYHGKPVFIKTAADGLFCGRGYANGKVMGEFVCDKIYTYTTYIAFQSKFNIDIITEDMVNKSCLSEIELFKYESATSANTGLFGWNISDLVIYDEPKELSDFGKSKPPQSWCYVEEE